MNTLQRNEQYIIIWKEASLDDDEEREFERFKIHSKIFSADDAFNSARKFSFSTESGTHFWKDSSKAVE